MKTLFINLILIAAMSLLFAACASDRYGLAESPEEAVSAATEHAIPIDKAVANLYDFLSEISPESTKNGFVSKAISSVDPIKLRRIRTKSDTDEPGIDNLVYLVNFENGSGYAMVAADDRLEEDVILYVEDGSLSEEELVAAFIGEDASAAFPGYPTTGPGIIIDGDGDQHINPNTFEPYDEASGDTYIGDLTLQDCSTAGEAESMGREVAVLALEYTCNQISRAREDDRLPEAGEESLGLVVETEYGNYVKAVVVEPMLASLFFWHQDYPFNRYAPMVKTGWFSGERKRADAGCVPLAVAKIVAHFRFPQNFSINGVRIDWDSMSVQDGQSESAARLISWIGNSSHSIYTSGYTGTLPSRSARFLTDYLYYKNVKYDKYDTEKVTKMLDKGYPLFVSSLPRKGVLNYDFSKAHGWNIDGYYLRKYDQIKKYYRNGVLIDTVYKPLSTVYVHCDFGWGGLDNGHFVSGIFDLGSEQAWDDDQMRSGNRSNYNWYLKIITYDPPIQK